MEPTPKKDENVDPAWEAFLRLCKQLGQMHGPSLTEALSADRQERADFLDSLASGRRPDDADGG